MRYIHAHARYVQKTIPHYYLLVINTKLRMMGALLKLALHSHHVTHDWACHPSEAQLFNTVRYDHNYRNSMMLIWEIHKISRSICCFLMCQSPHFLSSITKWNIMHNANSTVPTRWSIVVTVAFLALVVARSICSAYGYGPFNSSSRKVWSFSERLAAVAQSAARTSKQSKKRTKISFFSLALIRTHVRSGFLASVAENK